MIVSWEWLKQYVDLKMSHDELVDRLTMSGLNHEGTEEVAGDPAIDLEVTSNRADCLGHVGVAREISVLFDVPLTLPAPELETDSESVADHCAVEIQCPDLCYRYTARMIKGVKVGPSPEWLANRLRTLGIAVINNVVDVTNYVMFECGQPIHAFDFAKIKDGKIVVRESKEEESFVAIDHKTYPLSAGMCVIADSESPVAIGGVMGGADSEVSESTTDVLIEAAYFDQLSVRNTARALTLHSPSSFRFERDIDSSQIDWASRRVCELILETAGGTLLDGVVDAGQKPQTPKPIVFRLAQLERVLGIKIPEAFAIKTMRELGMDVSEGASPESETKTLEVVPPTWRKDLTREVDLVEEVGRIYGFDKVPDDAKVPMAASFKTKSDRVIDVVRNILTANGFDEAMSPSLVPTAWSDAFSPWSDVGPLVSSQPMLGVLEKASHNVGAVEWLRRSLVPSLLEARRLNEYRSNSVIELFETAKVYLTESDTEIPKQPEKVAFTSGGSYYEAKAVVESLVARLNPSATVSIHEVDLDLLDVNESAELRVGKSVLGYLGTVSKSGAKQFRLRNHATVAELDLKVLQDLAVVIPLHQEQSLFPAVSRDFNFIVKNGVHWTQLKEVVQKAGGDLLESVEYCETFRDEAKDGAGMKRMLLTVVLRSDDATLTGDQADATCDKIIAECQKHLNAALVA